MITDAEVTRTLEDTFLTYWEPLEGQLPGESRLAHYTSAATARDIIAAKAEERSIWLRNATEMNDFSEVEFGQTCLIEALQDQSIAQPFRNACDAIHADLKKALAEAMGAEFHRAKSQTYLFSLSVHSGTELDHGRLSMWRAYGGDTSVCLVFNTAPFVTSQSAYSVFVSPLSYDGPVYMRTLIQHLTTKLTENCGLLSQVDPTLVLANLKFAFDAAIATAKHPAFKEEQEWRLIYRPSIDPRPSLPSKVVCVGGVVQQVHFFPMQNAPGSDLNGVELSEILHRIIVGPTGNPQVVKDAFISVLREAQVENAESRVVTSDVPLRR